MTKTKMKQTKSADQTIQTRLTKNRNNEPYELNGKNKTDKTTQTQKSTNERTKQNKKRTYRKQTQNEKQTKQTIQIK